MLQRLRYQFELFCLSLAFFSRIPIPRSIPYSAKRMNRSGRYFALVGALLGSLCALIYWLLIALLPVDVALLLTMLFSLFMTGAFHEDGLADMADGVGGGMTIERRLAIMKDSRLGTYGAAALFMALLSKYVLLNALSELTSITYLWVLSYTISRGVASSLIFNTPYVSESTTSKSQAVVAGESSDQTPEQNKEKPLSSQQGLVDLLVLIGCSLLPLLLLSFKAGMALIILSLLFRGLFQRWLISRLGGFTGDCLGAAQQLMELLIYLTLLLLAHQGVQLFG